jgi:cytoskeletal protein RodZ
MTKLSLAGAFAVVLFAAACERPDQSAADTTAASSTQATTSAPQTDTLSTTTTASTSTVTRASTGKKSTGSAARKTTKPVHAADSAHGDSILGRDSVIRFPIRRLPTVKH